MTTDEVRQHNEVEWQRKLMLEHCPESCAWRGMPHRHVYEAKLIDWDGRRIPDPEFPIVYDNHCYHRQGPPPDTRWE